MRNERSRKDIPDMTPGLLKHQVLSDATMLPRIASRLKFPNAVTEELKRSFQEELILLDAVDQDTAEPYHFACAAERDDILRRGGVLPPQTTPKTPK